MIKKLKRRLVKKSFKKTFREELRYGLAAAVGFLIAYAWRDPLLFFLDDFFMNVTGYSLDLGVSVLSALVVTFCGVIMLFFISRFLK